MCLVVLSEVLIIWIYRQLQNKKSAYIGIKMTERKKNYPSTATFRFADTCKCQRFVECSLWQVRQTFLCKNVCRRNVFDRAISGTLFLGRVRMRYEHLSFLLELIVFVQKSCCIRGLPKNSMACCVMFLDTYMHVLFFQHCLINMCYSGQLVRQKSCRIRRFYHHQICQNDEVLFPNNRQI